MVVGVEMFRDSKNCHVPLKHVEIVCGPPSIVSKIMRLCHIIDMHIWGRIILNDFSPSTFLWSPISSPKYFITPYFNPFLLSGRNCWQLPKLKIVVNISLLSLQYHFHNGLIETAILMQRPAITDQGVVLYRHSYCIQTSSFMCKHALIDQLINLAQYGHKRP